MTPALANRRHYDDALEKECARAQRTGTWLSILAIDVDHFKRYNDAYGHGAGDDCLRAIALAFEEWTRRGIDLIARPGGEEFAVLLPDTDITGAAEAAERVRASIEALYWAKDKGRDCVIVAADGRTLQASAFAS